MSDPSELETRKKDFDENTKRLPTIEPFIKIFWEALTDKYLLILMAAACLSLLFGMIYKGFVNGWLEGSTIFFVVAIIVAVTTGNDYMRER